MNDQEYLNTKQGIYLLTQRKEIEKYLALFQKEDIDHNPILIEILGKKDLIFIQELTVAYEANIGDKAYLEFIWTNFEQGLSAENEELARWVMDNLEDIHNFFGLPS